MPKGAKEARQLAEQMRYKEWEEQNPKPVVVVMETMEEMKALMMMEISQQPAHLRVYQTKRDKYGRKIKLRDPNWLHKAKVESERKKVKQEEMKARLSLYMEKQKIMTESRRGQVNGFN
tara:strand:+ start:858 stop:1214 length:357 start_codon:yes stop_codon:yes gene_type:complete